MNDVKKANERYSLRCMGYCPNCDAPWHGTEFCAECDHRVVPGELTMTQAVLPGLEEYVQQPRGPRPSWDETWTRVARVVAERSTCPRKRVGAVLVTPDNRVLATGYNGAPSGQPHCSDVGCEVDDEGNCVRSVHAELNAILGCTMHANRCIMYSTHFPCPQCAMGMVQAGVARLVCPPPRTMTARYDLATRLLARAGVVVDTKE